MKSHHYWKQIEGFKRDLREAVPHDALKALHQRRKLPCLGCSQELLGMVAMLGNGAVEVIEERIEVLVTRRLWAWRFILRCNKAKQAKPQGTDKENERKVSHEALARLRARHSRKRPAAISAIMGIITHSDSQPGSLPTCLMKNVGALSLNTLLVETRELGGRPQGRTLGQASRSFERRFIREDLLRHGWDMEKAAAELGLAGEALAEKVRTHQIRLVD